MNNRSLMAASLAAMLAPDDVRIYSRSEVFRDPPEPRLLTAEDREKLDRAAEARARKAKKWKKGIR